MDQFGRDQFDEAAEEPVSNRDDARDSLFLMAEMRIGGSASAKVRVRNLSTGGLMAEYPRGLDQGTAIEFNLRGIGWVSGRVAWSAAGRIGVAFDRPIDPLRARKPVGAANKVPAGATLLAPRR